MRLIAPLISCLLAACATSQAPGDGDGDGDGDVVDAAPGSDGQQLSCSKDPCDIYEQCGCASPQVCDLDVQAAATGGTECRDVTSPGTELSSCTSFEQCAGGYVCLGGAAGSQCRKYCMADTDCGNGHCVLVPSAGGNPIPGVTTCTKTCDPLSTNPAGCPATYGCGIADIGGTNFTDCTPANAANTNEADCEMAQCAPGFTCTIVTPQGGTPRTVCKQTCTNPGGACTVGACQGLEGGRIVDGVDYGVCI